MKRPLVATLLLISLLAVPTAYVHVAPESVLEYEFERQAWFGGVAKKELTAGATTWSYYEGGSGPQTLVLVHGFTGSKENWLPMLAPLTAGYRVIVPDLPG